MKELIKALDLDPSAPYSLGNKYSYYKRECNSGHKDLLDEEIEFAGGWYDGYRYQVPCCMRCINSDPQYPCVSYHTHNEKVHLIEVPSPSPTDNH
jgi:hypothetical protein